MNNKEDYSYVIQELKSIGKEIDKFLAAGRQKYYAHMKEVSPGLWISKDFKDLSECIQWLYSISPIPKPSP